MTQVISYIQMSLGPTWGLKLSMFYLIGSLEIILLRK